ncbi:DNA cytosine methyltransferase [Leptolyngbya sp. FACHB-36]|uniref:DNA cytosine methyltransferase n=1 Tax=Leptolyngbya sp. FACHB-36 TaxID=2692808 RepID=UPI0016817607|nr:DNA cytosine methyltransferase [Leptolyngbya sp. FACHB-36]MBD2019288.1 DNA cytosine methyltransferase [Leptolyngbya sp. FACHB-36]
MVTAHSKPLSHCRWLTAVDLFCGCGGVTAGLKQHNFRVVAAVDEDPNACNTYRVNHPTVHLYPYDIRTVNPQDIRDVDLHGEDLDLLVVCAPCQPFSSQNRSNKVDERSDLIFQATRFAKILKPAVIFFENVPGLATLKYRGLLDTLRADLAKLNYQLSEPLPIDAADYGVPQRRKRCILLAVLDAPVPPIPVPTTPQGQRVTVKQAIGHLLSLKSGEGDPDDPLHQASTHLPLVLERLHFIPKNGGSRYSLPPHLVLDCHRNHKGHGDVYGRMQWGDVAPTLTTGCTNVTRGRFAHPQDDRAITLREAALLQTFSPYYEFVGNRDQITAQIGNAVPVKLMSAFAPTLRSTIKQARQPVASSVNPASSVS